MASFAQFVVVSILAATGLGYEYELHTGDILTKASNFESNVATACAAEVSAGIVWGGAGASVGGLACAVEGSVVGAVTVAAAVFDVGIWAGCKLWDWAPSPSPSLVAQQIVAPPAMLRKMRLQFTKLKEPFAEMGVALSNMTKYINEKKWGEVAAKATLALGAARKFSLAMKIALKEGRCDQPPTEVTCPKDYKLLNDGDTNTCQNQPVDCYEACCREQDTWCDGDSQCQLARGCGPTLTPAPTFIDVNCEDLLDTLGDFRQATFDIGALHDCALKLEEGDKTDQGCSKSFEQNVRAQIKSEFAQVKKDLDTLTELYYKMAVAPPATALMDKRSNAPSNLVALDNVAWQQSYAQVSSSCDSMQRKTNVWLECKGSTAGGKMQVGEMPNNLFAIVFLLVVGCCVLWWLALPQNQDQGCCARRESATNQEVLLPDGAPLGIGAQKDPWYWRSPFAEKDPWYWRPVVFVIFLVVYTLLIVRAASSGSTPASTPALCQQNLQHAQTMFNVCDDFASALKAGSESGEVGLQQLLRKTVEDMAIIDKDTMPK